LKIVNNYKTLTDQIIKFILKNNNPRATIKLFLFLLSLGGVLVIPYTINKRDVIEMHLKYMSTLRSNDFKYLVQDIYKSFKNKNNLEKISLSINFKNLSKLDCQRQRYSSCEGKWANGVLIANGRKYNIKIKAKGDREIHRRNLKTMSFKIDIKGEERYKGMEEFSIQKPIIRNYTNEILISDIVNHEGLITPRHFYTKFEINGEYLGIRHIEESFAKELIESSKRRNGPIYSLNEEKSIHYGNTEIDLANSKYWKKNKKVLAIKGLSKLDSGQRDKRIIKTNFDNNLWAKYFSIMDLFSAIHGQKSKSVRFYLNPVTGLFEPIFYDGHVSNINRKDINNLIIDRVLNRENLYYQVGKEEKKVLNDNIKDDSYWENAFFLSEENIDPLFYLNYISNLERLTSEDYFQSIIKFYNSNLSYLRGHIYRSLSRFDAVSAEGYLPQIEAITIFEKRIKAINTRINNSRKIKPSISFSEDKKDLYLLNKHSDLPQVFSMRCGKIKYEPIIILNGKTYKVDLRNIYPCDYKNFTYSLDEFKNEYTIRNDFDKYEFFKNKFDIKIKIRPSIKNLTLLSIHKNYQIKEDTVIKNKMIEFNNSTEICISNNAKLIIRDSIISSSSGSNLIIKKCRGGNGSVIIQDSEVTLHDLSITGLSKPNFLLRELYGGINIIRSKFNFNKLYLDSIYAEDAINFIKSEVEGNLVEAQNINSDALDFDASQLKIGTVRCRIVKNDCLDFSYSFGKIGEVYGSDISDKFISAGEKSTIKIDSVNVTNSEIGVVSKDASILQIKSLESRSVRVPIAVFIKKTELGKPSLFIDSLDESILENSKIAFDSNVYIKDKRIEGEFTSLDIENMLYGNIYGRKTLR
tara:strand:+ start:172 stop:2757 length:2586 start_codon:yes stop_codon:yes gene_type:complete